jgi:hypothetical protein
MYTIMIKGGAYRTIESPKEYPLASRRVEADPRFFQNSKVRYTIFSAAFCTCCLKAIPLPP